MFAIGDGAALTGLETAQQIRQNLRRDNKSAFPICTRFKIVQKGGMQEHFLKIVVKAWVCILCSFFALTGIAAANPVQFEFSGPVAEELETTLREALPEGEVAATPIHARRQGRRARTVVKDTLNAFGYYAPQIDISVTEITGAPHALLLIETGPLFRIDKLRFKFADPAPRAEDIKNLKAKLPLAAGDPAIPADIIDAERVLGVILRGMGYAFADIGRRDVIGDKEAATISVRYNISAGNRVRFGDVVYPKDIRTKQKYLTRLDPTKPQALYDPAKLALYNSRLSETRIFNISLAKLSGAPVDVTPDGDAVHDIILDLKERPRNTVALGANFGTNEGFGVNAELTRRNLTRRGDVLTADTRLSEREMGLNLIWRRPNELGFGKGSVITAAILDEDTDAFTQQTAKLGIGLDVIKSQRLNYSFGVRGQYIRQEEAQARQDFQTLSAYAGFNLDKSDSLLDPRKGWRAEGRIIPTYAFGGGSNKPYARLVTQGRAYLPLDEKSKLVIAGRVRAGVLYGAEASEVPGVDRFYAGGGGSVRGYGYQAIGPVDANDKPLGGRSLLDSSVEARWRYNDRIGIVGFVDAGNISDSLHPKFDNLRVGAGIGARYMTPAGPLRLDVAMPLNPSDTDDNFQVYISIGQAF